MVAPKAVELRENAEGLNRRFALFVEFYRTEDLVVEEPEVLKSLENS